MSNYNKNKILNEIIEFCRFPVPKTAIDIVRFIKYNNSNFYAKTPDKLVVKFLRKNFLDYLVEKGILVKYSPDFDYWAKVRKFLSFYESKNKNKVTRKVNELYQINFFYFKNNSFLFKLPVLKEVNLDLVVLFYNLLKNIKSEEFENFSFELINLLMIYRNEKFRDKLRLKIYDLNLEDKEINSFEKIFEYSLYMNEFFNKIPFKPYYEKGINFLEKLKKKNN